MSAAGVRILFSLGARLQKSAGEIERLSLREIVAWVKFFSEPAPAANDGVPELRSLSRAELRVMFNHGARA
jgi:hypothetical protein